MASLFPNKPVPNRPAAKKTSPDAPERMAKKRALDAARKEAAAVASGAYDLTPADIKNGKGGKDWTQAYGKKK